MILTTLALLLGATLPAGGAAVVCFGADHAGLGVAVEVAGGGHCHDEREDGVPAAEVDSDCVDVAAAALTLDRPGPAADATPALLALPGLGLDVLEPAAGRLDPTPLRRPPPHLGPLSVRVLRV